MNDADDPGKFWMVYCVGGGSPTKMHSSYLDARIEAIRLAKKSVGHRYVVLCATDIIYAEAKITAKAL